MPFFIAVGKRVIPRWLFSRLQPFYHRFLAWGAAAWYRHPSRAMLVIGITGTNGKSTVVEFTHHIFARAGIAVASISSLRARVNESEERNESGMTMPGRLALQRFLARAKAAGCRAAIVEVTSEGIAQYRHRGIDFDIAAFTNLAPEHIERHGSFNAYRAAKAELFSSLAASLRKDADIKKIIVVNGDDEHAEYFLKFSADQCIVYQAAGSRPCLPAGRQQAMPTGRQAEKNFPDTCYVLYATNLKFLEHGGSFDLENISIQINLPGAFNVMNALCAAAIARSQGIPKETIKKAIEEIKIIPGRMEYIQKNPFAAVVDYAHTPDALEKVYQTVKGEGKLICVLGAAGGGRDKWKRPELGRIASSYCNEIILTNEDPYDENPKEILHQIAQGLTSRFSRYSFVLNRREAIERALSTAKEGDAVIITGKGAEPWMHGENGKKIKWDDRETAREILDTLKQKR